MANEVRLGVHLGAGLLLAGLVAGYPTPAAAQWFVHPYRYYYPVPTYPRPYYPPPPVYQPAYPPAYAPAPTYAPPPPPRPSAAVAEVQRSLAELGYDPGPVDGLVGPRLAEAVQAFQRDHDQPISGRLSGETIGAIREAARSRDTQSVPAPVIGPPNDGSSVGAGPGSSGTDQPLLRVRPSTP